jgi:hypothetical protein
VSGPDLEALYGERKRVADADAELFEKRSERVSNLRGLSFAVAAGSGISLALGKYVEVASGLAGVAMLLFFVPVVPET